MKIVFESSTAIVTYLDNGHLLHTDRTSGARLPYSGYLGEFREREACLSGPAEQCLGADPPPRMSPPTLAPVGRVMFGRGWSRN